MRSLLQSSLISILVAAPALAGAQTTVTTVANANATVQPAGVRTGNNGTIFFNVQGSANGGFASFGVLDFQPAATAGSDITGLSLSLTQSNASFTANGTYDVYLTSETSVSIAAGASPLQYQGGDGVGAIDPILTDLQRLGGANFVEVSDGTVDTVDLLAGLDPSEEAAILAAVNAGSTIRLVLVSTVPTVSATFAGQNNFDGPPPTLRVEIDGGSTGTTDVTINELHYDNESTDVGEFVELAGTPGASLAGWQLVLYNGTSSVRGPYNTTAFTSNDTLDANGLYVVEYPTNGIQNGAPDGLALVDPNGTVVEFLSYEGTFVAASGPAAGQTSTDIGVEESGGTPIGSSLQRINGEFVGPLPETRGAPNDSGSTPSVTINEFHYDNVSTDVGEFIELAGPANADLGGWRVVLYNGTSSVRGPYNTIELSASDILTPDAPDATMGFFVIGLPTNGLQNGAPDGLALVEPTGRVVEFLSYEGTFVAASGPAAGQTSTDIGVAESGNTPVGFSLQRVNGVFTGPIPETRGTSNGTGGPSFTPRTVMQIQGATHTSPEAGNAVETSGVVTAVGDFDAVGQSDERGFFVQDPTGDGDIATSDAIFVVSNAAVSVGDQVVVQGTVEESGFSGELTYTRIRASGVTVSASGVALPTPTIIGASGRLLPTEVIEDDNFTSFDPTTDAIDFFESLEAMRVTVQSPLAISNTNRFGEIFVVSDNGVGATGISARGTLNISPTDFNPEKIQIDPGREDFDPNLVELPAVDTGATLADITGVIGYDFGNFQVQPEGAVTATPGNLTPEFSQVGRTDTNLLVASYNVLNLDPNNRDDDDDVGNGRFAAIAGHIVDNLRTPDVIALQEVQDNSGSENDGVTAADVTLTTLVDAIVAAGGPTYAFIDNTFIGNNTSGGQPGGNIRTAFLYDPARVDLVPDSVRTVDDRSAFTGSRLPLIASFTFKGETVIIVNNHFSSKGGSAPIFGTSQPFEARQEEVAVNGSLDERLRQSAEVRNFIDGVLAADADANLVVLGDMNEFEFVSPVSVNLGGALDNLMLELPEDERYTFNFQGNSQSLDHILINPVKVPGTFFDIVHVNSEFADTPARASDHDPLVVKLSFVPNCRGRIATIFVDATGTIVGGPDDGKPYAGLLRGTKGADVIIGTPNSDTIRGGRGNDSICAGAGDDDIRGGRDDDFIDGGEGSDRCRGNRGDNKLIACER